MHQSLLSKGLINTNNVSLNSLLFLSEMQFLKKVLNYDEKEAPELSELYKEKLDVAK